MNTENKSSRSWAARLVGEIVDGGGFSTLNPEHMDRLLAWMAGREGPSSDLITAEFSTRSLDETESKRLVLSALDDRLFGDDLSNPLSVLGLDRGSDQKAIKSRYRRLMQIYHPDRSIVHGDWLTSRAETINQAYSRLNSQNSNSRPYGNSVRPATPAKPGYSARVGKDVYPAPQDKFHLRKSLGSAQKFQREVLIALVVVSVLLLGLTYISSWDTAILPHEETPTVDLGEEGNPKAGGEGSRRPEPGAPEQDSTSSTPEDKQLSAEVEQPEPVVEQVAEVHVERDVEDVAIKIQDADQKLTDLKSTQEGAIDSQQSATDAHIYVEKETETVKERPISSSTEPTTNSESLKQTAPNGVESRIERPEILAPGVAGKKEAEPEQSGLGLDKSEQKKNTASATQMKPVPDLPKKPAIPGSRRSSPKKIKKAGKDPNQAKTLVDSTGDASRPKKNREKKETKSVPPEKTVEEPIVRAVEVSKVEVRPDYQRKPTTLERFVAKRALVRYVEGIVEGDIDKVSYAVGQQMDVNGTPKSRGRLVTEYHTLFRNTSKRKYDFLIQSWLYIGNETIRIEGEADIRYQYHSSPAKSYKGKLIYYLVKKGLDAKLVRVEQE